MKSQPKPSPSPVPTPQLASNPTPSPKKAISNQSSPGPKSSSVNPPPDIIPTSNAKPNVDTFIPSDQNSIDSFLEDSSPDQENKPKTSEIKQQDDLESDSDDEGGNPMVASIKEDIDDLEEFLGGPSSISSAEPQGEYEEIWFYLFIYLQLIPIYTSNLSVSIFVSGEEDKYINYSFNNFNL